jgi:hypothetical protein
VGKAFHPISIATGAGLAALALLLAPAPAAAEQVRATLSVTATVVPACTVRHRSGSGHAVACSTGASVATMTARRHDEQPLDEAAAILGAPVLRRGDVVFTAPVRVPAADASEEKAGDLRQPYLTVTY